MRWGKDRRSDYYDYNLIAVIVLLVGFGLVMLYSTSSYTAEMKFNDDMYFFRKQASFSVVCIIAAIVASRVLNYHILWTLSTLIYLASLVLMAMVYSPLGRSINGARRWLYFGSISFQPAELAKIAVIVYIPMMIVKKGRSFRTLTDVIPPLMAGLIQALAAYIFTSNLSTALIILIISVTMIFVAHPKTAPFLIAVGGALAVAATAVILIANGVGGGFRARRVLVWLHPDEYASEGGYQIMQALYAMGSGGIFGKGLGNSTQKLGAVPEASNDMVFSIICEELGIFGGIIIVLLFIYLLYRLFFIAQNAPDLYGSLMVTGIFAHIAIQVILNLSVALNLIPTTGITLPFISYGGTSVVFLMVDIMMALAVSGQIRFKQKELDLWGEVTQEAVE